MALVVKKHGTSFYLLPLPSSFVSRLKTAKGLKPFDHYYVVGREKPKMHLCDIPL